MRSRSSSAGRATNRRTRGGYGPCAAGEIRSLADSGTSSSFEDEGYGEETDEAADDCRFESPLSRDIGLGAAATRKLAAEYVRRAIDLCDWESAKTLLIGIIAANELSDNDEAFPAQEPAPNEMPPLSALRSTQKSFQMRFSYSPTTSASVSRSSRPPLVTTSAPDTLRSANEEPPSTQPPPDCNRPTTAPGVVPPRAETRASRAGRGGRVERPQATEASTVGASIGGPTLSGTCSSIKNGTSGIDQRLRTNHIVPHEPRGGARTTSESASLWRRQLALCYYCLEEFQECLAFIEPWKLVELWKQPHRATASSCLESFACLAILCWIRLGRQEEATTFLRQFFYFADEFAKQSERFAKLECVVRPAGHAASLTRQEPLERSTLIRGAGSTEVPHCYKCSRDSADQLEPLRAATADSNRLNRLTGEGRLNQPPPSPEAARGRYTGRAAPPLFGSFPRLRYLQFLLAQRYPRACGASSPRHDSESSPVRSSDEENILNGAVPQWSPCNQNPFRRSSSSSSAERPAPNFNWFLPPMDWNAAADGEEPRQNLSDYDSGHSGVGAGLDLDGIEHEDLRTADSNSGGRANGTRSDNDSIDSSFEEATSLGSPTHGSEITWSDTSSPRSSSTVSKQAQEQSKQAGDAGLNEEPSSLGALQRLLEDNFCFKDSEAPANRLRAAGYEWIDASSAGTLSTAADVLVFLEQLYLTGCKDQSMQQVAGCAWEVSLAEGLLARGFAPLFFGTPSSDPRAEPATAPTLEVLNSFAPPQSVVSVSASQRVTAALNFFIRVKQFNSAPTSFPLVATLLVRHHIEQASSGSNFDGVPSSQFTSALYQLLRLKPYSCPAIYGVLQRASMASATDFPFCHKAATGYDTAVRHFVHTLSAASGALVSERSSEHTQKRRVIVRFMGRTAVDPLPAALCHWALGLHSFRTKGPKSEAIRHFRHALRLAPCVYMIWIDYAYAFRASNQLDQALTACASALQLAPHGAAAQNLMETLRREAGKYHEGIMPDSCCSLWPPSSDDENCD